MDGMKYAEDCCCYEYEGDNKRCPVHGAHWIGQADEPKQDEEANDER